MIEQKMKSAAVVAMVLSLVAVCGAVTPNYEKTTIYGSLGDSSKVVAYNFFDGLGRSLETQTLLPNGKSIVSGTYYDDAGRAIIATKPYVVNQQTYVAYSTDTNSRNLVVGANAYFRGQSQSQPSANGYAYSETRYYEDPLDRVSATGAPGAVFSIDSGHAQQKWYFGVATDSSFKNVANLSSATSDTAGNYFLTVYRDANGRFAQEIKDVFGQVVRTWAQSGPGTSAPIIASSKYDIVGNLVQTISPDGLVSTFTYDSLGQLIKKQTPDAGTVCLEYDSVGRVIRTITANNDSANSTSEYGRWYTYFYDAFGRMTRMSVVSGGEARPIIETYYDTIPTDTTWFSNNGISGAVLASLTNIAGRSYATIFYNRISCDPASSSLTKNIVIDLLSYDDEGRIVKKYKAIPGINLQTFAYEYDIGGKMVSETAPNGVVTKYSYDSIQRIQAISLNSKAMARYTYYELGHVQNVDLMNLRTGAGVGSQGYSYNIRDWLNVIDFKNAPSTASGVPSNFYESIRYNTVVTVNGQQSTPQYNGNISSIAYQNQNFVTSSTKKDWNYLYTYDYLNRLTKVTDGISGTGEYNEAFAYDVSGRITQKAGGSDNIAPVNQTYTYEAGTNKLKHITNSGRGLTANGQPNYVYDKNGNMVLDRSKKMTIEYDWRDMSVAFRFFSQIPDSTIDWKDIAGNRFTQRYSSSKLISEVRMLYDASGNRVLKNTCVAVRGN